MASGQPAEENDGEREAVAAGGRWWRAGEGGEKAVQGARVYRSALAQQFVEQVVCVLRAQRPGPGTFRGGGKGDVGRPA
jgi:hypothetical protein